MPSPDSLSLILEGPGGACYVINSDIREVVLREKSVDSVAVSLVAGALRLEVLAGPPVAVERKLDESKEEWTTVEVLDPGDEALVGAGARFYVLSRMSDTLFQVGEVDQQASSIAEEGVDGGKKRKTDCLLGESDNQLQRKEVKGETHNNAASQKQGKSLPKVDAPFSLLWVRALGNSSEYNTGSFGVRLRDLVTGKIHTAVVSNYMIDLPWLLSACPGLCNASSMIIVHGEKDERAAELNAVASTKGFTDLVVHAPPLPIMFGTHHSKAFLLWYGTGVRVIVHTANLIYADCNNKTQGIWWQDFPRKTRSQPPSDFEVHLLGYLAALKLPLMAMNKLKDLVEAHDFAHARVRLVTSVPGYHRGNQLDKFGHMRVRSILQSEQFGPQFTGSQLAYQFSSIGSLDEKWLAEEFTGSLASGRSSTDEVLGLPPKGAEGIKLVWPNVIDVKNSVEGWAAGYSIPGSSKNIQKSFLKPYFHRYDGECLGRRQAMPHIKTYTRYRGQDLAWVILTSHNLSKAAWGSLQKQGTQLMIRSYEMGVLFGPSTENLFRSSPHRFFSCTDIRPDESLEIAQRSSSPERGHSEEASPGFKRFHGYEQDEHDAPHCLPEFPLPYRTPPRPYESDDIPWMVDHPQEGYDRLGRSWGEPVSFYGKKDEDS